MNGNPKRRKRDPREDFYPTPGWVTTSLLGQEIFDDTVWEPACGDGSMVKPLEDGGYGVLATDIQPRGCGDVLDFLSADRLPNGVQSLVTNPPFAAAEEFVHKALELRIKKFALLTRYAFLEGQGRHARLWSRTPPARVWIITRRLVVFGKTSQFAHSWLIWDANTRDTRVGWLTGDEVDRDTPARTPA